MVSDESQLFGASLVAPPRADQIALTFDDGPHPVWTPRLLDVLARHGVYATFFLIGAHVLKERTLTREIAAAGHTIGNHTMHHPWLPRHGKLFIRQELAACNQALEEVLGAPASLFRAPHGARRPAVMRSARELKMTTVQWNLIAGDWKSSSGKALTARVEAGIARNRRRGQGTMAVLHDGSQHPGGIDRRATLEATDEVLKRFRGTAEFVTPTSWQ